MKKTITFILAVILLSCNRNDNIKIINDTLKQEINQFITRVNKSKYCKSDYITVDIEKDTIYISNSEAVLLPNLVGISTFKNSKVYFYANSDYYNYIKITHELKNIKVNEKYDCECDPPMDRILIIDKKDKNKFHFLPPPNLKNVK